MSSELVIKCKHVYKKGIKHNTNRDDVNHTGILMKYNNCCYRQNKEIIDVDNTRIAVFLNKEEDTITSFTSRFESISFQIPTAKILRDITHKNSSIFSWTNFICLSSIKLMNISVIDIHMIED